MEDREPDCQNIPLTEDSAENIEKVIRCYKNVLVCGVKGVGKITNTVQAVRDRTNVCYIGNPVDYEGKSRPVSYEKYLSYILSLKSDLKIIRTIEELFPVRDEIILIIDEIYGRTDTELALIGKVLDMPNVRIIQIVGCMKYMGGLIEKIDAILELHLDGAFMIEKELGKAICGILGKK
jgi:hypothetical protein